MNGTLCTQNGIQTSRRTHCSTACTRSNGETCTACVNDDEYVTDAEEVGSQGEDKVISHRTCSVYYLPVSKYNEIIFILHKLSIFLFILKELELLGKK